MVLFLFLKKKQLHRKNQMRTKLIAGNWKMNNNKKQAMELVQTLLPKVAELKAKIVLCVPFTNLDIVSNLIQNSNIALGAQNISYADSGAYTGEISGDMLQECGTKYVIVGHSERRQYFSDNDNTVNKRLLQAIKYNIHPIICIGESENQKQAGETNIVCKSQLSGALAGVTVQELETCIIAYEPIWAIGTGKTATSDEANETIRYIRSVVAELYGTNAANNITILYGGSMNSSNAAELLSKSDIDGGLIGGASLKADDFANIIKNAK